MPDESSRQPAGAGEFVMTDHALARVWRWPQVSLPRGARLVDELERVLSVMLAIVIVHLVGAQNISWTAYSGYMVMRGHVADALLRGALALLRGALRGAGAPRRSCRPGLLATVFAGGRGVRRRYALRRADRPPRLCMAVHRPHLRDDSARQAGPSKPRNHGLRGDTGARSRLGHRRLHHRQHALDADGAPPLARRPRPVGGADRLASACGSVTLPRGRSPWRSCRCSARGSGFEISPRARSASWP